MLPLRGEPDLEGRLDGGFVVLVRLLTENGRTSVRFH